jgi:hypothetical protein
MEIVQTHMTKWGGFPFGAGGDDVANLHWAVDDDDAIDEQFHQLAAVGKGALVQGGLHPRAEGLDTLGHGSNFHLWLCLRLKLARLCTTSQN